jgi:hypothetical protein
MTVTASSITGVRSSTSVGATDGTSLASIITLRGSWPSDLTSTNHVPAGIPPSVKLPLRTGVSIDNASTLTTPDAIGSESAPTTRAENDAVDVAPLMGK